MVIPCCPSLVFDSLESRGSFFQPGAPRVYFADDAWGIEYYAGYKIPVAQYGVKAFQPYVMGDRLEYVNGRNYQRIDNGLGVTLFLDYGFRVDYEHVFTSSTDNQGDMNLVRFRYDF